jgi:hypothetical protein
MGTAGRGVGEDEASSEAKGEVGGFEGVATPRDVVHELHLAEQRKTQVRRRGGDLGRQLFRGARRAVVLARVGFDFRRGGGGFGHAGDEAEGRQNGPGETR